MYEKLHWIDIIQEQLKENRPELNDFSNFKLLEKLTSEIVGKLDKISAYNMLATSLPPFFHGTDLRIVNMSDSERQSFHTMCKNVCKFLWQFYSTIYDCESLVDSNFSSKYFSEDNKRFAEQLRSKLADWNQSTSNTVMYRYESKGIYLTTEPWKAKDYAYRARFFGEIGSIAYYMIKGIEYLNPFNLDFSDTIRANMSKIVEFGENVSHPVIFLVDNIHPEFLYHAFSSPRKKVGLDSITYLQDAYYEKDIVLEKEKAMYLKPRDN